MRWFISVSLVATLLAGCGGRARQPEVPAHQWVTERGGGNVIAIQQQPVPVGKQMEGKTGIVNIVMTKSGFDVKELSAVAGGVVRIHLRNDDAKPHNFILPRFGIATSNVQPGAENFVEFTAGEKGDWPYYSDTPGQPEPGFTGTLRVH